MTTDSHAGKPFVTATHKGIALIIERIVFWWRVKNKQRRIVKEVLSSYKSDKPNGMASSPKGYRSA